MSDASLLQFEEPEPETDGGRSGAAAPDAILQAMLECSMDAALVLGPGPAIRRANAAARQLLGHTAAQLRRPGLLLQLFAEDHQRLAALVEGCGPGAATEAVLGLTTGAASRGVVKVRATRIAGPDGGWEALVVLRMLAEQPGGTTDESAQQRLQWLEAANADFAKRGCALRTRSGAPSTRSPGTRARWWSWASPRRRAAAITRSASRGGAARARVPGGSARVFAARLHSLEIRPVDLGTLAAAAVKRLQAGDPQRLVEFHAGPGLRAVGDLRLLDSLIAHLIGNAWKFTRGRERTVISLTVAPGPGGRPVYCVEDNGVGFDMAYADQLFTAFQRLHPRGEFPGIGNGLAVVRRIVERHGGRVWADAAEGRGARFYFTLRALTAARG